MYIYADETGNTGRNIFEPPGLYQEGAILALDDIEPIVSPILDRFRRKEGVARIHANEIRRESVREIGETIIDTLDAGTTWQFHLTVIDKPYLATTKFVDTVFDSGENLGARWHWYNIGFLRHTLCCLIDEMLTDLNRRAFWEAYLADDREGVKDAVRNARTYLDRCTSDRRLETVVLDAFDFALQHPEEITLMASRCRSSYKGHTPNMVAFTGLIQGAHDFADAHNVVPQAFYHDQTSEFGTSMREDVEIIGRFSMKQPEITRPWTPNDLVRKEYNLGRFSMPSSKDYAPLQAVDVLLWVMQRDNVGEFEGLKRRIQDKAEPFYISRGISELIRLAGLKALSERSYSDDDLRRGQELRDEMEEKFKKKVREFSRKRLGGLGAQNEISG